MAAFMANLNNTQIKRMEANSRVCGRACVCVCVCPRAFPLPRIRTDITTHSTCAHSLAHAQIHTPASLDFYGCVRGADETGPPHILLYLIHARTNSRTPGSLDFSDANVCARQRRPPECHSSTYVPFPRLRFTLCHIVYLILRCGCLCGTAKTSRTGSSSLTSTLSSCPWTWW